MTTVRKRLVSVATTAILLTGLLGSSVAPAMAAGCPIGTFVVFECVITGPNNASGTLGFDFPVRMTNGSSINTSGGAVTLNITGDLTMQTTSTIEGNDDTGVGAASATPITINVTGDMLMEAGTRILAENNVNGGSGAKISIDVDGGMTMSGASGNTPGALISTRKLGGAGDTGNGGDIVITVGNQTTAVGDLFLGGGNTTYGAETGAQIDATGRGPSGDITITVAGNYLSQPGSVVSSGGHDGTTIQQGGKIYVVVGCALTTRGRITSKGPDPGADLVHLEGCDVLIQGLVESTGKGHTVNASPAAPNRAPFNSCDGFSDGLLNEIVHADKPANATGCIEVWGKNITIDSTLPWAGELNADIGNGGPQGMGWIDIYALSSLVVKDGTGNDRTSDNLGHTYFSTYAVHANAISGSDHTPGIVTAKVKAGPSTASGNAYQAATTFAGSDGGSIDVEASGKVTLDNAFLNAPGDFDPMGGVGLGGHIVVASWFDDLHWLPGDADVRPNPTGDIKLNACGLLTTGTPAAQFHGEVPATTNLCDAAKPAIPAYVFFNEAQWAKCTPDVPGTKSGVKYEDLNGNGVKDAGEPGLVGWTIKVFNDIDNSNSLTAGDTLNTSQNTGAGGAYSFSLDPGEYVVCEVAQGLAGTWFQSAPANKVCDNAAVDSSLAPGGYAVTITSGSNHADNDFGNFRNGTKSGFKYNDVNSNGNADGGAEVNLGGWTIWAFRDDDGNGQLDASELTDGTSDVTDGTGYSFSLAPGKYFICEATQPGWTQTSPQAGDTDFTDKCDDQNATVEPDLAAGGYYITVTSGSTDTNNEFGNHQTPGKGTKSGVKYEDLNGNGVKDAGEPGLVGWTIKVFNDIDNSNSLTAGDTLNTSQNTGAGGAYSFSLDPGEYVVCEVAQGLAGTWFQSAPANKVCDNAAVDSSLAPGGYAVTITSGSNHADNDFGNFRQATKTGLKFSDLNDNGARNDGEPVISGWAIHLFGTDGLGNTVHQTTTTNGSGIYSFTVNPGSYTVCEEDRDVWSQTYPMSGADCSGHTDGGTFTPAPLGYGITLTSHQTDADNDFGNFNPPTGGGQGCTPGFWQGGVGADLWDSFNDLDWTAAGGTGTNPFIHTTLFNSFFTPHPYLNGVTVDEMMEIVGTGGGPVPAQKAARMLIAAYLNASFGLNYGFTPAQLSAKWTAAVAGGDAALMALQQELGALNEQGCTISNSN